MIRKIILLILVISGSLSTYAQQSPDSVGIYKKRVLENAEVDILASYYQQDGDNAAVTGGRGTEELTDVTPAVVVTMPLNADDILTVDVGISAYTSASSSNVNPFDGDGRADAFQASSGASSSDTWFNFASTYSHSTDDRNSVWTGKISVSSEFDYFSVGAGGSYARLFNEQNTELSVSANVYVDKWNALYPYELRPFTPSGNGLENRLFTQNTITGNPNYNPKFTPFENENRNSYSVGLGFSQILNKRMQSSLSLDMVKQHGLLSTPFQRVYFADVPDSYIEEFQLADDIERLPDNRLKIAVGGRLNYYVNEWIVLRSYYRYYTDDWGIHSHTASLEVPIKIADRFTIFPSYRFYNQTAADYFAPYETHLSSEAYYTSDYDLSGFLANQYGFGVSYSDIFTNFNIWRLGLKSIDLRYHYYRRDSGLTAGILSGGFKFIFH